MGRGGSLADAIARCERGGDLAVPHLLYAAATRLERAGVSDLGVCLLAAGQSPVDVVAVITALEGYAAE